MSVNHSGHRQRLKRALSENGLMSFSPHEVIELMLYTALPRRDVNELAHRIDDALGGVSGLMRSGMDELTGIGLSEHTAQVLLAFSSAVKSYKNAGSVEKTRILNRGDLSALKETASRDRHTLVLLNAAREVIFVSFLPESGIERFIAERALIYDAAEAMVLPARERKFDQCAAASAAEALKLIDVSFSLI